MLKIPPNYRIPVGVSVVAHVVLLVILAIKLPTATLFRMPDVQSDAKIIHAVAVNSVAVQNELNRIKTQDRQKHAAEQARLQALQQQALALQKQRQVAQMRISQLQAERLRLQKEAEQGVIVKRHEAFVKKQALAKQQALKLQQAKAAHQQKWLTQQQQLQNQMAQEQKQLAEARASQLQGVLDQYKAQIIQAIEQQWLIPDNANKDLSCVLLIHLAPNGVVLSVQTVQTSGDAVLDRSARDAVFKASPLPVPQDLAVFAHFRELRLTVRPLEVTRS